MQYRKPSLFRRLLLGFAGVLITVTLIALANVVYEAKSTQRWRTEVENDAHAREALLNFSAIADDRTKLVATAVRIEEMRAYMFQRLGYLSHVRLRLWKDGVLLYNSAPLLPDVLPAYATREADRAGSWVRSVVADRATGLVVERCHEVDDEWMLSLTSLNLLTSSSVFSLPLLLIPAWIIVGIGLRPLRRLAALIEGRDEFDLTPLPDSKYRELSPLVAAINSLLVRLAHRIEREHIFIADAAHELKTPLAVIQLNAQLILKRCDAEMRDSCAVAAAGLNEGIGRASHMVHQLLAFERAVTESDVAPVTEMELNAFIQGRLAAAVPLALARGIELEFDAQCTHVQSLHAESMAALLDNLISNAIKYSPHDSCIAVTLARTGSGHRMTILDQGPGIPAALRQRVFERFYRIPGEEACGSGLGLAIAEYAARRNAATITLADGVGMRGLCVRVDFPLAPA